MINEGREGAMRRKGGKKEARGERKAFTPLLYSSLNPSSPILILGIGES